jgi:hypothetical protein
MMVLLERVSARRRIKRAAEQSLAVAVFPARALPAPMDHTAWILNGLWPPELQHPSAKMTPLAQQLDAELRRIAADANQRLWELNPSDPRQRAFSSEELRVLNVARSLAVLQVDAAVQHLRAGGQADHLPPAGGYPLSR